ncbi:MAG: hypothetical protein P8Q85_01860 [Candidatus Poseidoniaceae archaeon]|nr:hypothetical protein [Candidatus Poseidoniaceae archaeon]
MRWHLILVMLLLHSATPLASTIGEAAQPSSRSTDAIFVGLDETVVHRNELVEVQFTLHNRGSQEQTFTINATSIPSDLLVSGLPLTHTLESGYLKNLKFNLSATSTASYATLAIGLEITSSDDGEWSEQANASVLVAPYSRLDFGTQDISSFISDAGTRTSVAVNITNNASFDDDVLFNFYTTSGWNWGWTMNNSDGVNAYETLAPGQLAYVYLWVDVPEIIDGSPLANTGPRFQLKAVSGLDRAVSQWSFDLLLDAYRNASIDAKDEDLVLDPGANGRISVDVRNVGNINNRLNITLQAIDQQGQPVSGVALEDRIARNGWTMALFGGLEEVELGPNETRTIEIGFQAPGDYTGTIDVRVRVFALGAQERVRTIDVGASIEWKRNATVALQTDECRSLLPNATCSASVFIENTGNARDTFSFHLIDAPPSVVATLTETSVSLNPFESIVIEFVEIQALSEALAFQIGDVDVEIHLAGTDTIVGAIGVPTKIAPVISWVFEDIEETIDKNGRLSISMTARNEGNAVDGLLVQLQSSHSTPMSFIPPFIAVYEENIEYPRSYEITNIPIGFNFTIEAWVDLPQDQFSNGTVYVNTTVRSQFAPDEPFVQMSTGSYLGTPWQATEETAGWFNPANIIATIVEIFTAWLWVIISIVISVAIIQRAYSARKERTAERQLFEEMHAPQPKEAPQDWMQKFQEKPKQVQQEAVMAVSAEHFQQAFTNRAGAPTPTPAPVQAEIHGAAAQALDAQDNLRTIAKADDLLLDIETGNVAQQVANQAILPDVVIPSNMTVRHDPKEVLGTTTPQVTSNSVPLPSVPSMMDLDDLDV